jgi:hypothetical protein
MEEVSEKPVSKQSAKHTAVLERAMKRLKRWDEVMGENAKAALEDHKFALLGQQWDEGMKGDREGRPCLTVNKLAQYINQVVNEQRQAKQAIKVVGVDGKSDKEVARIETGLIRNIEYNSRADIAYETAYEGGVAGGVGYFGVITCYADEDTFEQDIRIRTFENFLAVKLDCDSSMPDGSDANWAFVEDKEPRDEFEEEHGKYNSDAVPDSYAEAWHDDDYIYKREYWEREREKVKLQLWSDGVTRFEGDETPPGATIERERDGYVHKVTMYMLCGDRVLSETEFPSRFIPIFPVYGKRLNVAGKVHIFGLVRFARDPQKMFNYWRTAMAEKIALAPKAPLFVTPKMIEGFEPIYNHLNVRAYPFVPFNPDAQFPGAPQRVSADADVTPIIMANQQAEMDIKESIGIRDPYLGQNEGSQSGRAILALQKQGDTATFNYSDNLARAKAQCGRVILDLIPKIYDTERLVRVLGEDGQYSLEFINKRVPIEGGVMQVLNDVTLGKYDVEVTTGPSFATKRMEVSQAMLEFMQAYQPAAPFVGPRLAKLQDWEGAEELAEELKSLVPNQGNPQAMVQQVAQQAQQAMAAQAQGFQKQIDQLKEDKRLEWAKLGLDARKLKIEEDKAENERLKSLQEAAMTDGRVAEIVKTLIADMQLEATQALDEELADAALPGDEFATEMAPEMPVAEPEIPAELPPAPQDGGIA